jgi:hypothetical protein
VWPWVKLTSLLRQNGTKQEHGPTPGVNARFERWPVDIGEERVAHISLFGPLELVATDVILVTTIVIREDPVWLR